MVIDEGGQAPIALAADTMERSPWQRQRARVDDCRSGGLERPEPPDRPVRDAFGGVDRSRSLRHCVCELPDPPGRKPPAER